MYNKMYSFKLYSSVKLDKCINPHHHHHSQGAEHFHHLKQFSLCSFPFDLPYAHSFQTTIDLLCP